MFRAHARKPFNVAVTLPPFDVESLSHGAMNFGLGCAGVEHPCHEAAPLVNFILTALAVGEFLAEADGWWFRIFIHPIELLSSHLKRAANLFGT